MSGDVVDHLRQCADNDYMPNNSHLREAADELEKLREQLAFYKALLTITNTKSGAVDKFILALKSKK